MPEDQQTLKAQSVDHVQQFKDNNIQQALFYIRQLKVHCVLFVPANDTPENVKALLYSQMVGIAELYKPEKATI